MFRVFAPPLIALFFSILFVLFYSQPCHMDPRLLELASYSYRSWSRIKVERQKERFQFYDVSSAKVEREGSDLASLVEHLSVSVIKAKKAFLLIGGIFIEEGKSFSGVKFLGIRDGEVLLEVDGRIFRKRF